jgi:hypothetical protein
MWSQLMPNLSCLQNNPLENNVEPVPAKSELPPKTIRQKIMWSQFPPNLSWFLVLLLRISFLFLKNIETFLCKWKLVNNRSIPSTEQPYNHDNFSKISRTSTALQK